jgi:DNA-directed RNA polymerase subunit K/omega
LKEYGDIDSKFRYVILASKRAKQLLKGAKPKIASKSKNLIRVAQQEVQRGMIEFEIIQNQVEDFIETDDDMFIGEEIKPAPPPEEAEDVEETGEEDAQETEKDAEAEDAASSGKAAIKKAVSKAKKK